LAAPPVTIASRVRRIRLFHWPGRRKPASDRANSDGSTPSPSNASEVRQSPAGSTAPLLTSSVSGNLPSASLNDIASTGADRVQPGLGSGDSQAPGLEATFESGTTTIGVSEVVDTAGAAESPDPRGLLMRALDVPESSPWKIRGWIQNSFTYNANGRGS